MHRKDTQFSSSHWLSTLSQLTFKLYWIVHGRITASDKCMSRRRLSHFRRNKNEQCTNKYGQYLSNKHVRSIAILFLILFFLKIWNSILDRKCTQITPKTAQHTRIERYQNRSFIARHTFVVLHFLSLRFELQRWLEFHSVWCELPYFLVFTVFKAFIFALTLHVTGLDGDAGCAGFRRNRFFRS